MHNRLRKFCGLVSLLSGFLISCSSMPQDKDLLVAAISEKNIKVPQAATGSINGGNSRSKYEALRKFFASGVAPPPSRFIRDEILLGKCVFEGSPQVFFPDMAHTFVEQDLVLGKIVYFIPLLVGVPSISEPTHGAIYEMTRDQAREWHKKAKNEKAFLSALQFEYPKDSAFYDLTRQTLRNSAYFYYSKPGQNVAKQSQFRMRLVKNENRELIAVEHLCPYLLGCALPEKKIKHLEPYAYCYYARAFEFQAPAGAGVERGILSYPTSLPVPIREPTGSDDVLGN